MFGDDGRTATVPPPPRARLGRRSNGPAASSPEGLPTRRRWGRFAAGAVLALLGAWVFATLYLSAGQRVEVLALSRDVGQWEVIEDDDLRTVRVAADENEIDTVDASDRDDIVGRRASSALHKGQLLSESVLVPTDDRVVEPTEGAVPLLLDPGEADVYEPGMEVGVVLTPEQGSTADDEDQEPPVLTGWIKSIGDVDEQSRKVVVSIVVNRSAVGQVAAAANDDRIKVVSYEGFEGD